MWKFGNGTSLMGNIHNLNFNFLCFLLFFSLAFQLMTIFVASIMVELPVRKYLSFSREAWRWDRTHDHHPCEMRV